MAYALTSHTRTLSRAVEIAGSMDRLADFLCRPIAELVAWSNGVPIPTPWFLAMVDIVAENALTSKALDNIAARKTRRTALADVLTTGA
jgi:hypothetical protein